MATAGAGTEPQYNLPAAVNSLDVSLVRAEMSDALCLSSTARATVTEKERNTLIIIIYYSLWLLLTDIMSFHIGLRYIM